MILLWRRGRGRWLVILYLQLLVVSCVQVQHHRDLRNFLTRLLLKKKNTSKLISPPSLSSSLSSIPSPSPSLPSLVLFFLLSSLPFCGRVMLETPRWQSSCPSLLCTGITGTYYFRLSFCGQHIHSSLSFTLHIKLVFISGAAQIQPSSSSGPLHIHKLQMNI